MVVKEGGLKLIQIQDNGTGIRVRSRVRRTSEEQVLVCSMRYLQEVAEPFPVLETGLLWMGLFDRKNSTATIIVYWVPIPYWARCRGMRRSKE